MLHRYPLAGARLRLRLVAKEGKSPAQVARDLRIAEQTLGNWRKAYKADKLAAGIGKPVTPEQMEVARLKGENNRLKMEFDIQKKSRSHGTPPGRDLHA